jgi:hypothetical protein
MKTLILLFLFTTLNLSSQKVCGYFSTDESYNIYNLINSIKNSDDDITAIVGSICTLTGIAPNFVLQRVEGKGNCYAINYKDLRYILYDRDFLQYQAKKSQTDYWAIIFIIAHEIGHHLNGHTLKTSSNEESRNNELQADKFAGNIIQKMGGSIEHIEAILDQTSYDLFSYSETHPSKIDRLQAASEGFKIADILDDKQKKFANKDATNSIIVTSNLISKSIELNNTTAKEEEYESVAVSGKAYNMLNEYNDPRNWYISSFTKALKSKSNCFIFKAWTEDYSYQRVPDRAKENPYLLARLPIDNFQAKIYTSYTLDGENAFIFKTYCSKKPNMNRTRKILKLNKKVKNTSDELFPDKVYTTSEKDKLLYLISTSNNEFPYEIVYIDIKGYQAVYDCLDEKDKSKYVNPSKYLEFLQKLDI